MRRRTFDALMVIAGLGLAILLVVAGGLLTWAHSFVNDQVYNQLASQKIVFPPANSPAVQGPEFAPMRQYGGQTMTNGAQAEVYADHFILVHLKEAAGGKTYSELSALAMKDPTNTKLAGQVATVFKGTTLRSMLLEAYGFWKMGQIAGIAAIVAFVGAGLMLILSFLGLWHVRRVPAEVEVLSKVTRVSAATAPQPA